MRLFPGDAAWTGCSHTVSVVPVYSKKKSPFLLSSSGISPQFIRRALIAIVDLSLCMNTLREILDEAGFYLSIIFYSVVLMAAYNIQPSVIHALGDSRSPLFFLVLCSALNAYSKKSLLIGGFCIFIQKIHKRNSLRSKRF
jgi:hypothetical protein